MSQVALSWSPIKNWRPAMKEDFPKNELEFDSRFSHEPACQEYLFRLRWPEGFVCPDCGHTEYWKSARGLYLCRQCERQQSVTAGTIFPDREALSGQIEADEFYLGGERSGKRGRGADHKCKVAIAVERQGRKLG